MNCPTTEQEKFSSTFKVGLANGGILYSPYGSLGETRVENHGGRYNDLLKGARVSLEKFFEAHAKDSNSENLHYNLFKRLAVLADCVLQSQETRYLERGDLGFVFYYDQEPVFRIFLADSRKSYLSVGLQDHVVAYRSPCLDCVYSDQDGHLDLWNKTPVPLSIPENDGTDHRCVSFWLSRWQERRAALRVLREIKETQENNTDHGSTVKEDSLDSSGFFRKSTKE